MDIFVFDSQEKDFGKFMEDCADLLNMNQAELSQEEWKSYWENGGSPEEAVADLIKSIEDRRPRLQITPVENE